MSLFDILGMGQPQLVIVNHTMSLWLTYVHSEMFLKMKPGVTIFVYMYMIGKLNL